MPRSLHNSWIRNYPLDPVDESFLSHWDFMNADGSHYYSIDPRRIPPERLDLSYTGGVFDVPEVWYAVERKKNPDFDLLPKYEIAFCKKLWEKYSQISIKSVFEVCCGICPHGALLARDNYDVTGVDASPGMINAVEARAKAQSINIKAFKRDVFQFSIPGAPPDAALLLANTFPLARNNRIDNDALVSQLRSVGTFLKRGALYIIDCGSPIPPPIVDEYHMENFVEMEINEGRVSVTRRIFPTDPESLSTSFVMGYSVQYPGGTMRLEYRGVQSFVSPQYLAALVELSKTFEVVAFHNWGDMEPGIKRDKKPYLAVLRRK